MTQPESPPFRKESELSEMESMDGVFPEGLKVLDEPLVESERQAERQSAEEQEREREEKAGTAGTVGTAGTQLEEGIPDLKGENAAIRKLSRIAELILLCDVGAIGEGAEESTRLREKSRAGLAAQLGCSSEDLVEITESYGEETWESMVLQERVRRGMDSTAARDISWDRLEGAVLRKLTNLVDADRVSQVGELLAIAKAANGASRGTRGAAAGKKGDGGVAQLNQNFFLPGDPANGVLPAGNLGTMRLKMSHRVQRQIEGAAEKEEGPRVLDSMEMLKLDEVQQAVEVKVEEEGENESD